MRKLFYSVFLTLSVMLLLTGCDEKEDSLQKFTVTFNSQGGSTVSPVSIEKGAKITKPTNPTNGEFIFVDWFKEAACTNAWDFGKDVVNSDITLYAKWTTVTYTVTFNTNGGSVIAPVKVAEGSTVLKPLTPSKSGVAFENWYKEAALVNLYDFSTPVTADITLYAKWITVTRETLETLIQECTQISSDNYTRDSYNAMSAKLNAAQNLLYNNQDATLAQIVTAYTELSGAVNALVALPRREVAGLEVSNIINGFVYVQPGQSFNLYAYAIDAQDEYATDKRVLFTYNTVQLGAWVEGNVSVYDNGISFYAKSDLAAGQTISVAVKSAENPAITKTITLKVAGEGELKAMFLDVVKTLPEPSKINYEHYNALDKANELYYSLSVADREDADVKKAYKKMMDCQDAYWDLPERIKYSFSGNVCTFTPVDDPDETMSMTFTPNGAFPAGTYQQNTWTEEKGYYFYQMQIIVKADGTGLTQSREATDATGTGATDWEDDGTFTYTNQGTQSAGGIFYMTFDDEEDEVEPVPPVNNPTFNAMLSRSIFNRK